MTSHIFAFPRCHKFCEKLANREMLSFLTEIWISWKKSKKRQRRWIVAQHSIQMLFSHYHSCLENEANGHFSYILHSVFSFMVACGNEESLEWNVWPWIHFARDQNLWCHLQNKSDDKIFTVAWFEERQKRLLSWLHNKQQK